MNDPSRAAAKKILVLGASGGVGREVVRQALAKGLTVSAQTRDAGRLQGLEGAVRVLAFDPTEPRAMAGAVQGQDAVVFALGVKQLRTTLFSSTTRVLLPAMKAAGVRRLVAITGVGAGDTKGHGGFVYDRLIFPLFTKHVYADKDVQERLIEASDLDWVIVRPAPFTRKAVHGPLQAITHVGPGTVLRRITRSEVAAFVVEQLDGDAYLRTKVFIGHP